MSSLHREHCLLALKYTPRTLRMEHKEIKKRRGESLGLDLEEKIKGDHDK